MYSLLRQTPRTLRTNERALLQTTPSLSPSCLFLTVACFIRLLARLLACSLARLLACSPADCVQVDGVCGSSCGFDTTLPKYCLFGDDVDDETATTDDDAADDAAAALTDENERWWAHDDPRRGRIPRRLLMKPKSSEFDDDDAGSPFGSESNNKSAVGQGFHIFFIVFMTISALSLWISFLPGACGRSTRKKAGEQPFSS